MTQAGDSSNAVAIRRLGDFVEFAERAAEPTVDERGEAIYDFSGPRKERRRRPYGDDEIIAAIKAWAEFHDGEPPSSPDWNPAARRRFAANLIAKARWHLGRARMFEEGPWPSVQTVRQRFGSMNAALVAAGFEPRAPGRQPKTEPDPIRLEANEIARAEVASEARFRHLVRRLLEAQQAGDAESQRTLWYEMAEVAVVLGDRVPADSEIAASDPLRQGGPK